MKNYKEIGTEMDAMDSSEELTAKVKLMECVAETFDIAPDAFATWQEFGEAVNAAIMPYPEFPVHVENLNTIAKLEAQGWEGTDVSLEISLFEYGFAWRTLSEPDRDGDDIYFIYAIEGRHQFDRCGMKMGTDPTKEWNWVFDNEGNVDSFYSTLDTDKESWMRHPFPNMVYDLLNHYGNENIFGSSYSEGFTIADPQDDEDEKTYCIRRHYHPSMNKETEDVEDKTGLTLKEAQEHCEASKVDGEYFDGYYAE